MDESEIRVQQKQEFGSMIRDLRLQQIQPESGRPWTQLDLALATGCDIAHINRIERGRYIPNVATLDRICRSLDLTWEQRRNLTTKAGHIFTEPPPTEREVSRVISSIRPHVAGIMQPATLLDNEMVIWHCNDLMAYTFYGYDSAALFLEDCAGLRHIELMMTPKFDEWFQKIIIDFDSFLRRQVFRFMELYIYNQNNEEYCNILRRIKNLPQFNRMWMELLEHRYSAEALPFVNQQTLEVRHPELGPYTIQIWHCNVTADSRFCVGQHLANDPETQQLFSETRRRFQER